MFHEITKSEVFELWGIRSSTQLIEDVIVSFVWCLKYNSRFFQQICSHVGPSNMMVLVKGYFQVFSKSAAVVIANCFCISNGLKGISFKELLTEY